MVALAADENFNNDILRGLLRRKPDLDIVRLQDACQKYFFARSRTERPFPALRCLCYATSLAVARRRLTTRQKVPTALGWPSKKSSKKPGLFRRVG